MKITRSLLVKTLDFITFEYEGVKYLTDRFLLVPFDLAADAIKASDTINDNSGLDSDAFMKRQLDENLVEATITPLRYQHFKNSLAIVKVEDDVEFINAKYLELLQSFGDVKYNTKSNAFVASTAQGHMVAMPFRMGMTKEEVIALLS